jgi:hypothetical protein
LVVAEVLTGIALVQQSVKFIKDNISTVQDIGQIATQIDDLFRGEKEAQQARAKKSGTGLGDQFGVDTVAKEIIDAKFSCGTVARSSNDGRHAFWSRYMGKHFSRESKANTGS